MSMDLLSGGLGALCLAVALLHLVRLGLRRGEPLGEVSHAVMGLGMAAMFVPAADPLPRTAWLVAFAAIGAWFAAAAVRARTVAGGPGHHLAGAVAMTFMLFAHQHRGAAAAGGGAHAHHGGVAAVDGGPMALVVTGAALLLAAYFAAHAVRHLTGQPHPLPGPAVGGRIAVLERVRTHAVDPVLHVAMGAAMAVMLLGMA